MSYQMPEESWHQLVGAKVTKIFSSPDGQERLIIFKRDDGTYGFDLEKWSPYPEEHSWLPWTNFASHCATEEIAIREALSSVGWSDASYVATDAIDGSPNPSFQL